MSGSQISDELAREALEEHRQIHFYLSQIAQTLQALRQGKADVESMRRLASEIEALKVRLQEHHQLEERGGLFRAILEAMPGARVEVGRLVQQHEKMIEILEMAHIHAEYGQPAEAQGLGADLEQFLEMFRDHERVEEKLLEEAFGE